MNINKKKNKIYTNNKNKNSENPIKKENEDYNSTNFENKNKQSDGDSFSRFDSNYSTPIYKSNNKDKKLKKENNDINYQAPIMSTTSKSMDRPLLNNSNYSYSLNPSNLPIDSPIVQNKEQLELFSKIKSPSENLSFKKKNIDNSNIPNVDINANKSEDITTNHDQNPVNYININDTLNGVTIEIKNTKHGNNEKIDKNKNKNIINRRYNNNFDCLNEEKYSDSLLNFNENNKHVDLGYDFHEQNDNILLKVKIDSNQQGYDEATSPLINETSLDNSYLGLETEKINTYIHNDHQNDSIPLSTKPKLANEITISEISNTEVLQENLKENTINKKNSIKLNKKNSLYYQLDDKNNNNLKVLIY